MEDCLLKTIFRHHFIGLWLPIFIISLWELSSRWKVNPFFPPPHVILLTALEAMREGTIVSHIVSTLSLFSVGFVVGGSIGVVAGAILGSNQAIYRLLAPIAVFLRSTPTAAKLPAILAILGIGAETLYFAVSLTVFLNVLIVTMIGVGRVERTVLETGRLLPLGAVQRLFTIRVMAATGDVLMALQTALQTGLLVTVLAEVLMSSRGLGAYLRESQETFQINQMWLALFLLGFIGVCANEGFHLLERRIMPWYFKTREAGI